MILLGKLICAARKLLRLRRVHKYRSPKDEIFDLRELRLSGINGAFRVCDRCGHTVPVKPSKPRATKQETVK